MTTKGEDVALTVKQVAAALGVSGTTVHQLIDTGQLAAMDIGTGQRTHWRIDQTDLDAYREAAKERTRQRQQQRAAS